jgi:hypothetical protein
MILISGCDQNQHRLPTFSLSSPKAVRTTATVTELDPHLVADRPAERFASV